nr:G-type lectin S-receptor-like serine/threonine-protein kinase At4g27290 [Tanacetum cinerariifolium]
MTANQSIKDGDTIVSSDVYIPIEGSSGLFQDVRYLSKPVTRSFPIFIPASNVSVGKSKLCQIRFLFVLLLSDTTRFPVLRSCTTTSGSSLLLVTVEYDDHIRVLSPLRISRINCSCTAYANLDIRNGGNGCLLWFDDLMDIREFNGGQHIYIRMASSELAGDMEYALDKKNTSMQMKHLDDIQIFSLYKVAKATDNFSDSNKIGEGGFGPVYKGVLEDGQEVAVKRLSETSQQGINEFKNELIFIAKLQHRNLVKLLGYCIHGDEMILIYEYMVIGWCVPNTPSHGADPFAHVTIRGSAGLRRFFRYAMFIYSFYLCYVLSLYPFTERYAQPYFLSMSYTTGAIHQLRPQLPMHWSLSVMVQVLMIGVIKLKRNLPTLHSWLSHPLPQILRLTVRY